MLPPRGTPLLPVTSLKGGKVKRRGSGSVRILLVCAIVFSVGYGIFAYSYIGRSKDRKAAEHKATREAARITTERVMNHHDAHKSRTHQPASTGKHGSQQHGADRVHVAGLEARGLETDDEDNIQNSLRKEPILGEDELKEEADEYEKLPAHRALQPDFWSEVEPQDTDTGADIPSEEVKKVQDQHQRQVKAQAEHQVVENSSNGSTVSPGVQPSNDKGEAPVIHTHSGGQEGDKPVVAAAVAPEIHTHEDGTVQLKGSTEGQGFFALEAVDIEGNLRHLSDYAGKVVLVVNVASACGYTDTNYKGLQETYEKYNAYGLEILGFPCNQFGKQEPGSEKEIKDFCTGRYHVTFPMFSKVEVNGPQTHPLYSFLKKNLPEQEGGGGGRGPGRDLSWNFNKFLVNKQGQPVKMFESTWDAGEIETQVYKYLHAS